MHLHPLPLISEPSQFTLKSIYVAQFLCRLRVRHARLTFITVPVSAPWACNTLESRCRNVVYQVYNKEDAPE